MENTTNILIKIPPELNYKVGVNLAKLRKKGIKITKHNYFVRLAEIGLIHEKQ